MEENKLDELQQFFDAESNGVDRRGFLQCMAWAGTGVLWMMTGGILKSHGMSQIIDKHSSGLKKGIILPKSVEQLPATLFIQVHKSYIVNIAKVSSIEGNMLHVGNVKITMGVSYAAEALQRILTDRMLRRK